MYPQKPTDGGDWGPSAPKAPEGSTAANLGGGSATAPSAPPARKPSCRALYDFEAQNDGELEFKEGDVIELISQIDENWYEGSLRGKTGYFPISYVHVLVPL
ncbi:unnamed protein product [Gongylonema pulchrum]|uniref:SH3 domain-containing protein n=1 Tax=Gongylonema pulchrum TaxID=637853 RepID=A0A183D7N6_9BILA|nr:unnamed protein product [Gongylonema pulchrum]